MQISKFRRQVIVALLLGAGFVFGAAGWHTATHFAIPTHASQFVADDANPGGPPPPK